MAHNLEFRNGQTSFTYNSKRGLPWHKLGQSVDGLMTAKECIVNANLDFEVELASVYTLDKVNETVYQEQEVPNTRVIRRKDDHTIFTTDGKLVTPEYKPFNNIEAFDFIDNLASNTKAVYETAGSLLGGKIIFITATLDQFELSNKDEIKPYLFFALYHNGVNSVKVGLTNVRIVCNNTLNAALSSSTSYSILHKGDVKSKIEESIAKLGIIIKEAEDRKSIYNKFISDNVSDIIAKRFISNEILSPEEYALYKANNHKLTTLEEVSSRKKNIIKAITNYYFNGIGQNSIIGSKWGLYNAFTGYYSNIKEYKKDSTLFTNLIEKNNSLDNVFAKLNSDFCLTI